MRKSDKPERYVYLAGTVFVAVVITVVFYFSDYIQNEGYNPSDDGVIIAQSYRIINGEIPHKDFISIRPALSGYLHTIHFYSPLPIMESSRWFVVLEYFIYSFLWTFLLFRLFFPAFSSTIRRMVLFAVLGLFTFIMNVNNYNLFPWTTIDGLFFCIIGVVMISPLFFRRSEVNSHFVAGCIGAILISAAALCKQNFIFPALFFFCILSYQLMKKRKWLRWLILGLAFSSPFIIYGILLYRYDATGKFINQMTGRTELFETGVLRFVKEFVKSWLLPVNIVVLLLSVFNRISKKMIPAFWKKWIAGIYFSAALFFTVYLFSIPSIDTFTTSFELFWIVFVLTIYGWSLRILDFERLLCSISVLIIAWTSAISLGDNSPVFSTGLLASSAVVLSAYYLHLMFNNVSYIVQRFLFPSAICLILLLFVLSINSQRNLNYRDRPASELTCNLGTIIPAFGNIRTNPVTCNYFAEWEKIYHSFPAMKNNFVMIPNNPAVYLFSDSRNPFPLDWMQHDEYIGEEKFLYKQISGIIEKKGVFLVIEKFDSRFISEKLVPVDYNDWLYDYYTVIMKYTVRQEYDGTFFRVIRAGTKD